MEWIPLQNGSDENEYGDALIEIQGNRVLGKHGKSEKLRLNDFDRPYELAGNYLTVVANQTIGTLESEYFEISFKNRIEDKNSKARNLVFGLGKDLPECGNPDGGNSRLSWHSCQMRNCVCFNLENFRIRNGDGYLFYTEEGDELEDTETWNTRLETDIFGCGIDHSGKIYFTWNGKMIEYKQNFEAVDEKFENMYPFVSVGIQDIEVIANFGEQDFLYNPNRSLAYAWRKETRCLSNQDFREDLQIKNFLNLSKDVILVSTVASGPYTVTECHGLVLSCRSIFFKELFENDGFNDRTIQIDANGWLINQMVQFMYTDDIVEDDEDNICGLLSLGVKYKVESLASFCTDKLLKSLDNVENLVKYRDESLPSNTLARTWKAALECGSDLLAKRCQDLLKDNWQNITFMDVKNESQMLKDLISIDKPEINKVLAVVSIDTSDTRDLKIQKYLLESLPNYSDVQTSPKQSKGFSEEWTNLLKEKSQKFFDLFNDVTIVSKGGREFRSSSLFLGLQSKVFRKMIESEEVDGNKIEISKFDKSVVKRALKFLYTDSMEWNIEDMTVGDESDAEDELTTLDPHFSCRKLYGVLCFAIEYEIESLETMCMERIFQELSMLVYQPAEIQAFWEICREDENKQTAKICELLIKRNWNLTTKKELLDFFPYYYWEQKFLPIDCGLNYFDDFSKDVLIVAKDQAEIGCHRLLLKRQSSSKLFESNPDDGKIYMPDYNSLTIKQMVDFIHNGEVEKSNIEESSYIETFRNLLSIAIKYEIPSLEWYCSDKLNKRLEAEDDSENNTGRKDLLEIWKTAVETGSKIMKGRCISFFKNNLLTILSKKVASTDMEEKRDENEEKSSNMKEETLMDCMMAKDKHATVMLLSAALSHSNNEEIKKNIIKFI